MVVINPYGKKYQSIYNSIINKGYAFSVYKKRGKTINNLIIAPYRNIKDYDKLDSEEKRIDSFLKMLFDSHDETMINIEINTENGNARGFYSLNDSKSAGHLDLFLEEKLNYFIIDSIRKRLSDFKIPDKIISLMKKDFKKIYYHYLVDYKYGGSEHFIRQRTPLTKFVYDENNVNYNDRGSFLPYRAYYNIEKELSFNNNQHLKNYKGYKLTLDSTSGETHKYSGYNRQMATLSFSFKVSIPINSLLAKLESGFTSWKVNGRIKKNHDLVMALISQAYSEGRISYNESKKLLDELEEYTYHTIRNTRPYLRYAFEEWYYTKFGQYTRLIAESIIRFVRGKVLTFYINKINITIKQSRFLKTSVKDLERAVKYINKQSDKTKFKVIHTVQVAKMHDRWKKIEYDKTRVIIPKGYNKNKRSPNKRPIPSIYRTVYYKDNKTSLALNKVTKSRSKAYGRKINFVRAKKIYNQLTKAVKINRRLGK